MTASMGPEFGGVRGRPVRGHPRSRRYSSSRSCFPIERSRAPSRFLGDPLLRLLDPRAAGGPDEHVERAGVDLGEELLPHDRPHQEDRHREQPEGRGDRRAGDNAAATAEATSGRPRTSCRLMLSHAKPRQATRPNRPTRRLPLPLHVAVDRERLVRRGRRGRRPAPRRGRWRLSQLRREQAGTSVRERMYAEHMAKATAIVIGRKRNSPRPGISAKGASTRKVQSVETSSGIAMTSLAREVRRFVRGRPQAEVPVGVLQADDRAIDHRADRQGQAGQRHHVDRVARVIQEDAATTSTEIGSVMTAIAVIRNWPRNRRIVSEQRTAPRKPSCISAQIDWRT